VDARHKAGHDGANGTLSADPLWLLLALAFPAVFVNLGHGHNGFLTAALIGAALVQLDRRPILAGLLFGCLAYKPQFGLLIPLVLAVSGRWRAFIAAAVTVAVLTLAVTLVFGAESAVGGREVLVRSREAGMTLEKGDEKPRDLGPVLPQHREARLSQGGQRLERLERERLLEMERRIVRPSPHEVQVPELGEELRIPGAHLERPKKQRLSRLVPERRLLHLGGIEDPLDLRGLELARDLVAAAGLVEELIGMVEHSQASEGLGAPALARLSIRFDEPRDRGRVLLSELGKERRLRAPPAARNEQRESEECFEPHRSPQRFRHQVIRPMRSKGSCE